MTEETTIATGKIHKAFLMPPIIFIAIGIVLILIKASIFIWMPILLVSAAIYLVLEFEAKK